MLARAPSFLLAAAVAALFSAGPAAAGSHEHDSVRRAVARGEILPLSDILAWVRGRLPGEVVGVEIEREKGRWIYELRVVSGEGRLFDVYVDARDGAIEKVEER